MSVQSPRQFDELFAKAFNGGDADAMVELYEPDATVIPEPGTPAIGHAALREIFAAFIALNGQIDMRTTGVIESGDLAVVFTDWSFGGGTDPEGNPAEFAGRSTVVLRKQADGSWLGVIDDPYSSG